MEKIQTDLVIYQSENGAIEIRGDSSAETIWVSQKQIAKIFGVNTQAITKHIRNIYSEGELCGKATCSNGTSSNRGAKKSNKEGKFLQS